MSRYRRRRRAGPRFAREDVDLRRGFAFARPRVARLRDFAAFRAGFLFAALGRERFFAGRGVTRLRTRFTAFFAVGTTGRPLAEVFPASAPMAPPTAAPTGPAMLPINAPAAAPATGFEIGGIRMFSDDSGLSFPC